MYSGKSTGRAWVRRLWFWKVYWEWRETGEYAEPQYKHYQQLSSSYILEAVHLEMSRQEDLKPDKLYSYQRTFQNTLLRADC